MLGHGNAKTNVGKANNYGTESPSIGILTSLLYPCRDILPNPVHNKSETKCTIDDAIEPESVKLCIGYDSDNRGLVRTH